MLEVGESTGALPAMLNSVAEFYEEDVQTALSAAMALIEPLILIVMAVFVGGILISLVYADFYVGSECALELQVAIPGGMKCLEQAIHGAVKTA